MSANKIRLGIEMNKSLFDVSRLVVIGVATILIVFSAFFIVIALILSSAHFLVWFVVIPVSFVSHFGILIYIFNKVDEIH